MMAACDETHVGAKRSRSCALTRKLTTALVSAVVGLFWFGLIVFGSLVSGLRCDGGEHYSVSVCLMQCCWT